MKKFIIIYFVVFSALFSQSKFNEFITNVDTTENVEEKAALVDNFMAFAVKEGIPFIEGDTATFLLRGDDIHSTSLAGDINKGGEINLPLVRLADTDLWHLRKYLEPTARLDYYYATNRWVDGIVKLFPELDPFNSTILPWGILGQINEVAMSGFDQPNEIVYNENIPHGTLANFSLSNIITPHNVNVYLPPGYDSNSNERYPVAYFHDGSFYIHGGSAVNIIDNLIYENRIKPIIAVFLDPSAGNRTNNYFFETERFIDFFNNIVVTHIDENYKTIPSAEGRAVIGLSFGGNISPLIVNSVKDMYGYCGIHSGAFWPNAFEAESKILENDWDIKYYAVWGTYETKLMNIGRDLRDKMIAKNYKYFEWEEHPQGHSMGFWRAKTDEFLEYFFPPENVTSVETNDEIIPGSELFQNYPNPFNPSTTISFNIPVGDAIHHGGASPTNVTLKIYDTLGKKIATLVNDEKLPGNYSVRFDVSSTDNRLSSGIYYYVLSIEGRQISKKMIFLK